MFPFCGSDSKAQTVLTVVEVNGLSNDLELTTASSIVFGIDSLFIIPRVNVDDEMKFHFSEVSKLYFSESIINNVQNLDYKKCFLYPNPVGDFFTIAGEFDNDQLFIYSMTGDEVMCLRYNSNNPVDVSSLKPGSYLIQIDNQYGKFIKK